jgi:hypothetical protein
MTGGYRAPRNRATFKVTILLRVAVEGYAGSQLLGGVVADIVVPESMPC